MNYRLDRLHPFQLANQKIVGAFISGTPINGTVGLQVITGKVSARDLRRKIIAYVEDLEPKHACVLDIDLTGCLILDITAVFELNKARMELLALTDSVQCYTVIRGVSATLYETLPALLKYLKVNWVVYKSDSETPELMGDLGEELRETWQLAIDNKIMDASAFDQLQARNKAMLISPAARSNRLTHLEKLRLLIPVDPSKLTDGSVMPPRKSGRTRFFIPLC